MMIRTTLVLVGLGLLVAVVAAANLARDADDFKIQWRLQKKQRPLEVELSRPSTGPVAQTVTAPGTVELIDKADIASEIVGQVTAVHVEQGDDVRADDLLVSLDDQDARARLESTEARIERLKSAIQLAEADLAKAEREFKGFERLSDRGFSTTAELEDSRTLLAKMTASLAMSSHELEEMTATRLNSLQDLERTKIRAPMDGTVIEMDVEVGEVVIAGTTNLPGTVLMTIGDMRRMRVRAEVDETDVNLLAPEQPARIFLQSDDVEPLPGRVDLIAPRGRKEADVVSFETLIRVDGQHPQLRPAMTATVEIEVKRKSQALRVPVQAVVQRRVKDLPQTPLILDWARQLPRLPGKQRDELEFRYLDVVFVRDGDTAHVRPVETGISDLDFIEILAGLEPDDEVVIGPFRALDELKEGRAIKQAEDDSARNTAPRADNAGETK